MQNSQILQDLANLYMIQNNLGKSLSIYQSALTIVNTEKDVQCLESGKIISQIGKIKLKQEKLEDALQCFKESFKIINNILSDHALTADCISNIGEVYYKMREFQTALKIQKQCLKMRKLIYDNKSHCEIANSYNHVSLALMELGKESESLDFVLKSLQINQHIGDEVIISNQLNNIGMLYCRIQDFEKSQEFLQQSLLIRRKINPENSLEVGYCLNNLGYVYLAQKEFDKAHECLNKALSIFQNFRVEECGENLGKCFSNLSNLFLAEYDIIQATNHNNFAINAFEKSLGIHNILTLQAKGNLGNLYRLQGKHRLSKRLLLEYYQGLQDHHNENGNSRREIQQLEEQISKIKF